MSAAAVIQGGVTPLKAPFPWFGGKSRAAHLVWDRFGDVPNYVEPFAGSLAVLLGRPSEPKTETVNDLDAYLANFWRAVSAAPDEVAHWADWPVSEVDQHARHLWLLAQSDFRERMSTDPDYFDAKVAGWWVWGQCVWIGTGWCDSRWYDGERPYRKLPHLGGGKGVHRQLPHLGTAGTGVNRRTVALHDWLRALQQRLRRVRVACGNWDRILGESVTVKHGITGVLLDPPYATANGMEYATDTDVAHEVAEWAFANGDNPDLRIALCGYAGEHAAPTGWTVTHWKARKGYQKAAADGTHSGHDERIWFSPHCLTQQGLFDGAQL